ncbi:transposase, partial [Deinococcus piscis]
MRKQYASDLTHQEFNCIAPLLPPEKPGGRPRSVDMYEILCAIFYVLHNG